MRSERLGDGGSAADVFRALARRARSRELAPPAGLIGNWFDAAAVIAPSVRAAPHDARSAFTLPPRGTGPVPTPGDPIVGGGWIGYRAYPDRSGILPEAAGGWTDHVLRLDNSGFWWFESLLDEPCPEDLVDAVRRPDAVPGPWHIDWTTPDRHAHRRGVEDCLDAIARGDVYQACVCARFHGTSSGRPVDFFADAVDRTRPGRAAFVQGDWGAVASLSPELFLSRRGGTVTSSPIKGTLPLSEDPARLRNSVKDVAENVMIVDLVRNDLGRVADAGSVRVTDLLRVKPAPGVWHLVSTVTAAVSDRVSAADLLDAAFPPASVTGCPKHSARTLLRAWEPDPRGVYCGAVGMHSPLAGLELNVAIRTVEFDAAGRVGLGVGGGITIDSDPDAEWQECLDKASSIVTLTQSRTLPDPIPASRNAPGDPVSAPR
ncbi:aminodeoxychorismate synthase component I [Prescottella equi]|uniref:Aminodeoxychorismate synthase component I n=1 Tax=Rhodococcus hoagii TaxID=43767 RepID=A0AAE5IUH4_RHOHA|nr:aminodeoxychorismate synthase component I [Prescottella equi]AVP67692.1 aminodeoxychorismate synthase component I [Prescottella equi]ERN46761.1 aminodeoxychorismate synthase component I [Prescottella equi NBRC 101255 = C 7]MBM4587934.1 aminodeoxychorismate synthase component I [Prescottella equi]MBM4625544.1 aminodeoxychorismate synthase component I [Prescottella equi]NKS30681.1 aminodeoxychorismate synthase component I [Prescottella equi]